MESIHRSILPRALMAGAASLAFMMTGAGGVRAETVSGADGTPGQFCYGSPSIDEACAVNGGDGESVSAGGNPAVAIGGSGGAAGDTDFGYPGLDSDGTGNGGAGGSATAVATGGSIASASATGGAGGYSDHTYGGSGGDAAATSKTFGGSDGASSSATATGGSALSPAGIGGGATATAHALATRGGLATAQATATGGEYAFNDFYSGNGVPMQPPPPNPLSPSRTFGRRMRPRRRQTAIIRRLTRSRPTRRRKLGAPVRASSSQRIARMPSP
jgi:hypothetical protein